MPDRDLYENPLIARYAGRTMSSIFSPRRKFSTWRRLWIALAEAEHELGLDITKDQLERLRATRDDIDFDAAAAHEKRLRHDVMAHVHTWRDLVPAAGGVIHLGATSCFVTDNTDLVLLREGLDEVMRRVRETMRGLVEFCLVQADRPTLGFTHFQPAQFTTVGKRAALWLQDLALDHEELGQVRETLRFRGVKGTTGSQDSFMKLFDGDGAKVEELDRRVTEKMGFSSRFRVTGQTYTRKLDSRVLHALSSIAQSAHKFSNDLRLLCHLRELEEPFESHQIGSSAMAYKRNPMRSERIGSLSRFVISMTENASYTAATQWLERTLDDSANRRLSLPQAFLGIDAVLILYANVVKGLVVRDAVIAKRVDENLPFIASEELLMRACSAGGDRQELHELIRVHAMAAAERMKAGDGINDFLDRMLEESAFALSREDVEAFLEPSRFVGRAPEQVREFIAEEIAPVLARHDDAASDTDEVRV